MSRALELIRLQKIVSLFGLGCLVLIFAFSLVYRLEHPSLTLFVHNIPQQSQDPMGEIIALMQKLQKEPDNVEVLSELGNRFMFMRAWEKAMSFWTRLLKVEPQNKMALNQLGVCYFELEEYSKARDTFLKLIKIDDKNYRAYYNLAMLYKYYLGDKDKARAYLQKIVNAHPDDEDVFKAAQKELAARESN